MATFANGVATRPVVTAWFDVYTVGGRWIPQGQVGFQEVQGLERTTEAIKHKQGNDLFEDQIPGRTMASTITLVKGLDRSNYLERWKACVEENTALGDELLREDVIISLYDRQGTPNAVESPVGAQLIKQWRLRNAWISSLTVSNFTGLSTELGTVTCTLVGYGPILQQFPALDLNNIL
jgi:phage tail-like protein